MEYKFDEQSVKELMEWAQTAQLPQELELSKAERIFDVKLCVESDLSCIRASIRMLSTILLLLACIVSGRSWRRSDLKVCNQFAILWNFSTINVEYSFIFHYSNGSCFYIIT